ncbi:hypothetical protein [uncultured Actinomyces sp.]|uniref:hypothetical protein n=1 Tax=uncultured Actinomyces sp. TaxID=249061 RepID=UPI0028D0DDA5|nr:hypothetical protein [uncultured Actinomyces sp.]
MLSLLVTLQVLAGDVRDKVGRRLAEEKGASTVEWVIITGFLIVLAALVGRAVYSMVSNGTKGLELPSIGGN